MMEVIREHISAFFQQLSEDDQIRWMLKFGEYLTIAARGAYDENNMPLQLRGFNEIQNDIYSRIRDVRAGHHWPMEEWFRDLLNWAQSCEIQPTFGWALTKSIEVFKSDQHNAA